LHSYDRIASATLAAWDLTTPISIDRMAPPPSIRRLAAI